jgi:hypothetical protein
MAFLERLAEHDDRVVVHPEDECGLETASSAKRSAATGTR